jgi:hypothetical protein
MHRCEAAVGRCASRRLSFAIVACAMLVAPLSFTVAESKAPDEISLADALALAGRYVHQFEQDFSQVISDEDYLQTDKERAGSQESVDAAWVGYGRVVVKPLQVSLRRETHSEMLFLYQAGTLLAIRNVLWLRDEPAAAAMIQPTTDSRGRLDRELKDTSPGQAARLRALADESARFNLGSLYRNFNVPTLALQFLAPEYQPRFDFTIVGHEKISGSQALRLDFAERESPTVVMLNDKRDVFAKGSLWVRESDGAVLRTRLTIIAPQTKDGPAIDGSITVDYGRDGKLDMWVPRRMEEEYAEVTEGGEQLKCSATYSNYRRFETSGRLVSPQQ